MFACSFNSSQNALHNQLPENSDRWRSERILETLWCFGTAFVFQQAIHNYETLHPTSFECTDSPLEEFALPHQVSKSESEILPECILQFIGWEYSSDQRFYSAIFYTFFQSLLQFLFPFWFSPEQIIQHDSVEADFL